MKRKIFIAAISIIILFVILFIYTLTFSITGKPVTEKVVFPDAMAWNYKLVLIYKGYNYSVTDNVIPSSLIDRKLDTLQWNGVGGEGYDIYSIKTEWTHKQIAIKTKYGYLLANRTNKQSLTG